VSTGYVRLMDRLYLACIAVGVVSVLIMTGLIATGVFLRYLFNYGAQFAEPCAIFFSIQMTFYGAAACLRAGVHLSLELFFKMLPAALQPIVDKAIHLLLAGFALFMIVWGISLSETTWFQSYPEFQYVRVGLVYTAIPGSGLVMLLFVIESLLFREARDASIGARALPEHDAGHEREELEAVLGGRG